MFNNFPRQGYRRICCLFTVFYTMLLTVGCSVQSNGYVKIDDGNAYRHANTGAKPVHMLLPKDLRDKSLTILSDDRYAICEGRVFLMGVELDGAEADTFALLEFPYSRDEKLAFCGSIPLIDVDSSRLQVLSGSDYYSWAGRKESFEGMFGELPFPAGFGPVVVGKGYATDGELLFFGCMKTDGIDIGSFVAENGQSGHDVMGRVVAGEHNYNRHSRLPEATAKTMQDRLAKGLPAFPPVRDEVSERIR